MVGQLFQALTAGFSRFILSWLVPSVTTLSLFSLLLYPQLSDSHGIAPLAKVARAGLIDRTLAFAFAALLLALMFALGSRPLYRLLEGYTGPRVVRRVLLRLEVRRVRTLRRRLRAMPAKQLIARGLLREQLADYPTTSGDLLPTRLGNAFRALEVYGIERFDLDSQAFWYELHAVAPDRLRQDIEDARASVDFFIGFVGQLALLATVSLSVALSEQSGSALCLAVACLFLTRMAYNAAVRNMTDFRYAVQALVNVGRSPLVETLGYELPTTIEAERRLWSVWSGFVRGDQKYLSSLNSMRRAAADAGDREDQHTLGS